MHHGFSWLQACNAHATCGLGPNTHHHLEDAIQLLLVHLVRFIHVLDIEVQTVRHHTARINQTAHLECDHIFDVGSRITTAGTCGWDDRGLLVHPGARVYRHDITTLYAKNNHCTKLAHQPEDGVERLRVARRLHRDIRPHA